MAILVLPLNSALNPFLYTLNVVRDRLASRDERRLAKKAEKYLAVKFISGWVKDRTITYDDLAF